MFFNRIFSIVFLSLFFSLFFTTFAFAQRTAPVGLTFNTTPTGECNTSGTYTQYDRLNPQSHSSVSRHWSPTPPTDVYIGYSGNVTGYGYADMSMTYTVGAADSKSATGTHQIGYFWVISFVEFSLAATQYDTGLTVNVGTFGKEYGRYDWSVTGSVTLDYVFWQESAAFPIQEGKWTRISKDTTVTLVPTSFSGNGSWTVRQARLCPNCSADIGMSHFNKHKAASCSASITQGGQTVYCRVSNFWTCENPKHTCSFPNPPSGGGTPPSGGGGNPPPTDDTPNCQDCTSDCSSPCSCTNSGTCGGTVVDNTPNCSGCTSHCSSPCSCSDSGTCNGSVAAPPPTPTPPPELKECSEGHLYNPNNASEKEAHTLPKTCKRSGCNVSMKDCQNLGGGGCFSGGKEYKYHWL